MAPAPSALSVPLSVTPTRKALMFDRIIVGVDGSDGGRDALALARHLAHANSTLVLVTAFPRDEILSRGTGGGYETLVREDVDRALLESAGDDDRCRVRSIADSSPGRALHEEAEREVADLIVVGSCHHGAVGRVLLGDVSRATLHGAPCPVAVAPPGYRDRPVAAIRTIGVGFNGSDESRAALALAAQVAEAGDARLRLLTAVTSPGSMGLGYLYAYNWAEVEAESRVAAELEIARAAEALSVPAETETVAASPGAALETLSEHVDLVVAGSRGWGATHRVVLGSTTDHLTHHAHCPVIVVPTVAADRERPSHAVQPVLI